MRSPASTAPVGRRTGGGASPTTGRAITSDFRLVTFVAGTAAVTVLAWWLLSGSVLLTADLAAVYAVAAVGLTVIFGLGGLLSIAQAAVMAVGAYTVVLLLNRWPISPLLALLAGCAVGAVASGITGLIAIRIRSHYFILASIAVAEGVLLVITNQIDLTGGSNGMGLASGASVFGAAMSDPHQFILLAIPVLGLVWYLASTLQASRLGIALHAVRSDDYLALASGVPVHRCRLWATVIGGAFGGLAGGMLALLNGYIGPQDFGLDTAVLLLLMVVFGGPASNGGTILAAVILTVLTQGLLTVTVVGDLVYGVAILILLIFARDGLYGLGRMVIRRWRAVTGAGRDR